MVQNDGWVQNVLKRMVLVTTGNSNISYQKHNILNSEVRIYEV